MGKVVMVIAHSLFRDEELFDTKNQLEKDGHEVVIASSRTGECRGSKGGTAVAEIALNDIDVSAIDGLIFVGGPGTDEYFDNESAHFLAKESLSGGKVLAAICIAPVILARAGLLEGVKVTVFPSGADEIKSAGGIYTKAEVTVDGKIVTGNGPGAAVPFAKAVSKVLID